MFNATDIFPRNTSPSVEKLEYPIKNFKYVASSGKVKAFILFMEPNHHKIYYSKRELTERFRQNIVQMGIECQKFGFFYPHRITWEKKAYKFNNPPVQNDRKNSDTRLGFKFENKFLIKADFTFGLRTVKNNTAHIVQTLNVPLVIYLYSEKTKKILGPKPDGYFPYRDMHLLDMGVLSPHTIFRIPPGTTYLLYSTQKNFFSLDVVDENLQISYPYEDPTQKRTAKIPDIYDMPVQTPYIEEENYNNGDNYNESQPSCSNNSPIEYVDLNEFFQTPPFEQQQIMLNDESNMAIYLERGMSCNSNSSNNNNIQISFINPEQIRTATTSDTTSGINDAQPLSCHPTLNDALEKNIILTSPNFVENYRRLMYNELEKPPEFGLEFNSVGDQTEPLNLSMEITDDYYNDDHLMMESEDSQPLDLSPKTINV